MAWRLKSLFPRGLYGRAALILVVPVVAIQFVVSLAFIQRHFEGVTRQLTEAVVREVAWLVAEADAARDRSGAIEAAGRVALALDLRLDPADALPPALVPGPRLGLFEFSGRVVVETLVEGLPALREVTLTETPREVRLLLATAHGGLEVTMPRRRVSASNPHQLLVLMLVASALMTLVAYHFLRSQLRPITKLAAAAEAFGKGQHLPYRPRGADEVRAAGRAFLDMRARIERQIEQRTLMLSGVSHDLRTPMTRLRLGLAMLPQDDETRALLEDLAQMERLVDGFLAFARGDAMEEPEPVDPVALARTAVETATRTGQQVTLARADAPGTAMIRPQAVARALDNLLGNARRYARRAEVSVAMDERTLRFVVEDDGPGIPREKRDEALSPFVRLDGARDPNHGGGVGLGLAIAADVARSHGGTLRLGDSAGLGGLRAELVLAV